MQGRDNKSVLVGDSLTPKNANYMVSKAGKLVVGSC